MMEQNLLALLTDLNFAGYYWAMWADMFWDYRKIKLEIWKKKYPRDKGTVPLFSKHSGN